MLISDCKLHWVIKTIVIIPSNPGQRMDVYYYNITSNMVHLLLVCQKAATVLWFEGTTEKPFQGPGGCVWNHKLSGLISYTAELKRWQQALMRNSLRVSAWPMMMTSVIKILRRGSVIHPHRSHRNLCRKSIPFSNFTVSGAGRRLSFFNVIKGVAD